MAARTLIASINHRKVGELREENGIWSFAYDPAWLSSADSYALGPGLPLQAKPLADGSTRRPVQWYFDNLLPEEAQRTLLAKDAKINEADAFALLAYYGAESSGSLTLIAPDAPIPDDAPLRPLPDEALQSRIAQLPHQPLTHLAAKRMSLAGAQHKLAVTIADGLLYEPVGATASSHILKPDHPDPDYPHSVINEFFTMKLAGRLGLQVPTVDRRYLPAPIYLIQRFDRLPTEAGWQRTHCIDACQLLDLDKTYKYNQGSVEKLAELASLCRSKPQARVRLFEWLVFNVLTGNGDAHLKNLSFTVNHEGITLAPHYDLLSTAVYETRAFGKDSWPEIAELAWPILGEQRIGRIQRPLLLEAGKRLQLAKPTCERILNRMTTRIIDESHALLSGIEGENGRLMETQPHDIAATIAGEMRCLRAIVEIVIREMAGRLAP